MCLLYLFAGLSYRSDDRACRVWATPSEATLRVLAGRCVAVDRFEAADRYVEIQTALADRYVVVDHYVVVDRCAAVDRVARVARSVVIQNAEVPIEARSVARNAHVAPNVARRVGAQVQVVVPPGAQAEVRVWFQEPLVEQVPRCEAAEHCSACSRLLVDRVRVSQLLQAWLAAPFDPDDLLAADRTLPAVHFVAVHFAVVHFVARDCGAAALDQGG